MFGILGARMVAAAAPDHENVALTGVVLVPARGADQGRVSGNEADVPGRENGVGGRARGPVRVRRSDRRGRVPRTGREARDLDRSRVTGLRGRTGRAGVNEEMTGSASKMSLTPREVSTATTGWTSRGRSSKAAKGAVEIMTNTSGSPSTPTMEMVDHTLTKKGETAYFFTFSEIGLGVFCWSVKHNEWDTTQQV